MTSLTQKNTSRALLCAVSFLGLSVIAIGSDTKQTEITTRPVLAAISTKQNKIEIKDFAFNPQTLTVKSGEKIIWVNRDEEPHTVVSVEKQFKKSTALDTGQEFTITAGAPGTYTYFCSVHPKMTGTIVVEN